MAQKYRNMWCASRHKEQNTASVPSLVDKIRFLTGSAFDGIGSQRPRLTFLAW